VVTIVIILLLVSLVAGVLYLHSVGLPEPLRLQVIEKLKEKNIHVNFSSLKYKLNKGLVIENPSILEKEGAETPFLNAEELIVNVDKTKLLRGVVELDSVDINNGRLSINPTKDLPNPELLELTGITGRFSVSNDLEIESKDGIALNFEGIRIVLKGSATNTPKEGEPATIEYQELLAKQVREMKKQLRLLKWKSETPPTLTLTANGEISDLKTLRLDLSLVAEDLQYKTVDLHSIKAEGKLDRQLLQIDKLHFVDDKGEFSSQANLSLPSGEANFKVRSTIDLNPFIESFVQSNKYTENIRHSGSNMIEATGRVQLPQMQPDGSYAYWDLNVLGSMMLREVACQNVNIDYIGTEFSCRKDSLFLNNLQAIIGEGELNGRLLMGKETIKFSSNSSLPPQLFLPMLQGRGFDRILNEVETKDSSLFNISAKGEIDSNDITKWQAEGDIYIADVSFRDTKISEAVLDFDLTPTTADYSNVSVEFDHSNWHKYITYGGSPKGFARAKNIAMTLDPETKNRGINVKGLEAKVWPAPVVHLFSLKAFPLFNNFHIQAPLTIAETDLNFDLQRPEHHITGLVNLEHTTMSGYDINGATFELDLKKGDTKIKNIEASLDYSSYFKEKKQPEATNGKFSINEVHIIQELEQDRDQLIILNQVSGKFWPAAATALFSPEAAKNIESIDFTAPLESNTSNIVLIQNGTHWTTVLNLDVASLGYGGVPAYNAKSIITIDDGTTVFDDFELEIDYTNYPNRKKHGGSSSYKNTIKKMVLQDGRTTILDLKGTVWPGHIAAAFNPEVAKTLNELDFTSPLDSKGSDLQFDYADKSLFKADLSLGAFSYNSIPFSYAKCNMKQDDNNITISNLSASYSNIGYKMRKTYGGPSTSTVKVKSAVVGLNTDLLTLNSLSGTFYPGRLISIFQPGGLEEVDEFRFIRPPTSTTSAELLDTKKYYSQELKTTVYPLSGSLKINFAKTTPTYSGTLAINRLSIEALAKTYDFEDVNKGTFSTLFQFYGSGNSVKNLNTTKVNSFHIVKSNITEIPLLGPFSKITSEIGKTSKNDRLGYSLIEHASGDYSIKNGKLLVSKISALSSSLSLKGSGTYNLDSERVDMKFSVSGFKKNIILLELVRPIISKFPIIKGSMRYKVYGDLDKLKILPDI